MDRMFSDFRRLIPLPEGAIVEQAKASSPQTPGDIFPTAAEESPDSSRLNRAASEPAPLSPA
jgi:hypothetical protein